MSFIDFGFSSSVSTRCIGGSNNSDEYLLIVRPRHELYSEQDVGFE